MLTKMDGSPDASFHLACMTSAALVVFSSLVFFLNLLLLQDFLQILTAADLRLIFFFLFYIYFQTVVFSRPDCILSSGCITLCVVSDV